MLQGLNVTHLDPRGGTLVDKLLLDLIQTLHTLHHAHLRLEDLIAQLKGWAEA